MASSVTFSNSSFEDSNNSRLLLTNAANQTGTINILIDPQDGLFLSYTLNFTSNYNSVTTSFYDSNNSYELSIGLAASNTNLSLNGTVFASSNLGTLVVNSNNSIAIAKSPFAMSVLFNNSYVFSNAQTPSNYFLENGQITFGALSGNGTVCALDALYYQPISSYLDPSTFFNTVMFNSNVFFASNTTIYNQLTFASNVASYTSNLNASTGTLSNISYYASNAAGGATITANYALQNTVAGTFGCNVAVYSSNALSNIAAGGFYLTSNATNNNCNANFYNNVSFYSNVNFTLTQNSNLYGFSNDIYANYGSNSSNITLMYPAAFAGLTAMNNYNSNLAIYDSNSLSNYTPLSNFVAQSNTTGSNLSYLSNLFPSYATLSSFLGQSNLTATNTTYLSNSTVFASNLSVNNSNVLYGLSNASGSNASTLSVLSLSNAFISDSNSVHPQVNATSNAAFFTSNAYIAESNVINPQITTLSNAFVSDSNAVHPQLNATSNTAYATSNYAYGTPANPSGFVLSSGTTTTGCNVVVNGTATYALQVTTGVKVGGTLGAGNTAIYPSSSGGDTYINGTSGATTHFQNGGGSDLLTISPTIITASVPFNVNGTSTFSGLFTITNSSTANINPQLSILAPSLSTGNINLMAIGTAVNAYNCGFMSFANTGTGSNANQFSVGVYGSIGNQTYWTGSGFVGIGTSTPQSLLHISSSTNTANNILQSETNQGTDGKNWGWGPNGTSYYGYVYNDSNTALVNWLQVVRSANTVSSVNFPNGSLNISGTTTMNKSLFFPGSNSLLQRQFVYLVDGRYRCNHRLNAVSRTEWIRPENRSRWSCGYRWEFRFNILSTVSARCQWDDQRIGWVYLRAKRKRIFFYFKFCWKWDKLRIGTSTFWQHISQLCCEW